MSYERRPIPGRRTILVGLWLTVAAVGLHLLAVAVLPSDRVLAAVIIILSCYLLVHAVLAALCGLTRLRGHLRELHHRLAQALTDPVTGLPVRRVAEAAIAATDPEVALTVALADVDRLHEINHGPGGHAAGDRCLAEVGLRLRQAAAGDIVARLGGDEFVLITHRSPQQLADSLGAAFAAPVAVAGVVRPVEVSVGICQLPGGDPHRLLSCASLAMFTAKDRRSRIEVYDPARDGLPLPLGVRPAVRRRDRYPDGAVGEVSAGPGSAVDEAEAAGLGGLVDDPVDYFRVYRAEPETVFAVPAIADGQPPLVLSIAAFGGATVGQAYADNGWIYAVHLDGALVASGVDLYSGGFARTHRQMAAGLAACLAYGTAAAPALAEQAERLSVWAHDIEDEDADE